MPMVVRSCNAALAGIVAVLILSGCDSSILQGPAAIRTAGSGLEIAVCTDIEVVEAFALSGGENSMTEFWHASGSASLAIGDSIVISSPPDGLTNVLLGDYSLEPGDVLSLTLLAPEIEGINGDIYLDIQLPKAGIPADGAWLRSDGSEDAEPCF